MAYFFDGSNDSIRYATATDFVITGDLSFYIIVKMDSTASDPDLIVSIEGGAGESEAENSMLWLSIAGVSNSWDIRYIHEYSGGSNEDNTFLTNILNDTFTAIG